MNLKSIIHLFVIASTLLACGGSDANLWPNATGKPGEMMIIVDDHKWKSPVGDSLKAVFKREVFGLPQPEPMFDVINIPNKAFSRLFETHRNILRVKISPQNEENYVKIKRNVWARPQVYFEISAKNDSAFHNLFSKYKENILDSLLLSDRANYVQGFNKFHAGETSRLLKEKGIDLSIPKGFQKKSFKKDFIWISHETTVLNQGLLVFFLDYTDTAQFRQDLLIHQIDSVLKENLPSEANSYMQTEKVIGPEYIKYLTNNNFTVELRGLWETRTMGGPYVVRAIPEVQRNRITILMGFVYAPKLMKRNYMRQLEAIMSTIKFVSVPME